MTVDMGRTGLDSKIFHSNAHLSKFISAPPYWHLKCRFDHASLHCSMTVIAVKRIRYATKRIGNGVFTLLCLPVVEALWVVVAPRGHLKT